MDTPPHLNKLFTSGTIIFEIHSSVLRLLGNLGNWRRGESVIKGQSGGGWKVPQSPPVTPGHLYCSCYSGSQKPELWRKKLILGFFGQVGHGSMLLVSLCGVKEEEDGWNSNAGNLSWRDVRNFWDPKIPSLFCPEGGGVRLKSFSLKECYRIDWVGGR